MPSIWLELNSIIIQLPKSLTAIIVTNILLILCFLIGKIALYKFENAIKFFSIYAVFTALAIVAYFLSILIFSLGNLYSGNAIYAAMFPVFLFLPFIIGHFATYEKIHFYTNVQILTLFISLLLAFSFI